MCSVIHDVSSVYPVFIPNMLLWVIFTIMCLIYLISWALDYCIWHKLLLITTIVQLLLFQIFSSTTVLFIGVLVFLLISIFYLINYVKNGTGHFIKAGRR